MSMIPKNPDTLINRGAEFLAVIRILDLMGAIGALEALIQGDINLARIRIEGAADRFFTDETQKRQFLKIITDLGLFRLSTELVKWAIKQVRGMA